jgi:transcriptional regulator with XRE-family HTH domain
MKNSIYTAENQLLTSWLIDKRKQAGLSQLNLAENLKIHHSIIGKIETGERRLTVIEFVEYCVALNSDPNEIISRLKIALSSTNS